MKLLLINPPKTRRPGAGYISPLVDAGLPVSLLHLAAYVEEKDYDVEILDCIVDDKAVPQHLGKDVMRYGIPEDVLQKKIKESKADIIGITSHFTAQLDNVFWVSNIVKKVNKKIPVIVGGAAISIDVVNILKRVKSIDIAVLGEGEITLVELLEYFSEKRKRLELINGIVYRDNDKIKITKKRGLIMDLDSLPLPAYHLIDMNKYLELPKKGIYNRLRDEYRSVSLITSRGCPFNCVFCAVHVVSGKLWRAYSADYVIRHIKLLVEKYDVEQIHVEDDNFGLDMKRCDKIVEGVIKNKLNIRWDTPNGIRADRLNRELVRKMKKSGCFKLTIAPESGSQDVLDTIVDKSLDLRKVVEVAKICKEEKMPLIAFFVIGFPGETKKDIRKTLNFARFLMKKYGVIVGGAMYATPFYGTRLYEICKKKNYFVREVTPKNLVDSMMSNPMIKTEEFTPQDLLNFNKELIRSSFYYSAKRYIKHPIKLIKRFSSPFLIKATFGRFIKGRDV
jgi:magnesium-protoporphyrin IX monomethyl ester (oxidative) cyclase